MESFPSRQREGNSARLPAAGDGIGPAVRHNKFGGTEREGRRAALCMAEDWEAISVYTDEQAIADGVLIPLLMVPGLGRVNRITRAVFAHFVGEKAAFEPLPVIEMPKVLEPLMAAIRAMLKILPDEGGWRTGTYKDKKLWLVPNEVGGLTLMFPEDY